MTLKDILDVLPVNRITTLEIRYTDHNENSKSEYLMVKKNTDDPDLIFGNMIAAYFENDEVLELSVGLQLNMIVTVNRALFDTTVIQWKDIAADAVNLPWLLRDWHDE